MVPRGPVKREFHQSLSPHRNGEIFGLLLGVLVEELQAEMLLARLLVRAQRTVATSVARSFIDGGWEPPFFRAFFPGAAMDEYLSFLATQTMGRIFQAREVECRIAIGAVVSFYLSTKPSPSRGVSFDHAYVRRGFAPAPARGLVIMRNTVGRTVVTLQRLMALQ